MKSKQLLISSLENSLTPPILSEQINTDLRIQILGKYFKVDGKTPKMKYISSIRKDFENQDLDLVFAVFDVLRKEEMILVNGNNSYISKLGISYYHKNNI